MPFSPLISKIRCHNPNQKKSRVCNRNYLKYIATREGVDLTEPELEEQIKKQLTNDFTEGTVAPNDTYIKYISKRPNSHGLFGNIDISDLTKLAGHMADMTAEGKNIYRGIVSLSENDALNLGYDKKEKWITYMKSVMSDIGNQFGIPIDKLQWVGAVHMEPGHPHCHYMFWNADKKVQSPFIHPSIQDKCRQILSKEMFREEYAQEIANKTAYRDFMLEFGKDALQDLMNTITNRPDTAGQIPGRLKKELQEEISRQLIKLVDMLPDTGRITYKLVPPDVKKQVDRITELLENQPDIKKELEYYYNSTKNISAAAGASNKQTEWSMNKATADIEKRLGNIILATAKEIRREQSHISHLEQKEQERKELLAQYASYILFRQAFSSLFARNRASTSTWNTDKKFQSQSAENMRAHARKLKSHGYDEQKQS